MAVRASIVGAAETSVGKVRDHNEDSHFIDLDGGLFAVCDGMGGHAAGEVASALAIKVIHEQWASEATQKIADAWLEQGTPDARKSLLHAIQAGVVAAHDAIVGEAQADKLKTGMGTTLVGALVVGGDIVFAQCGDSRAYLVRDRIAMQLTEDHTLLARLLAAGVDVDTSNEGARFKSMLTNAIGIGQDCKAATFVVPVADGDRFLLCSDGITEYVQEAEIGEVLTTQPSPARAAQRLVELALQRGGGDNATALVVKVVEAGETARPAEHLHRENKAIDACPLWAKVSPQGRLRALRIALPRDYAQGSKVPANTLGDRVAWIVIDGEVEQDGVLHGPGSLLYPEALLADRPLPDKDGLGVARSDVRALAFRADDFREVCDDDAELGELLLEGLAAELAARSQPRPRRTTGQIVVEPGVDSRGTTDPGEARTKSELAELATAPTLPPQKRPDKLASSVLPGIPHTPTPRTPTPAKGRPTVPPPIKGADKTDRDELSRGPTQPQIAVPRADTKDRPAADRAPGESNRLHPRGTTPPIERLIVPTSERAAADAQLDRALDDLTVEPVEAARTETAAAALRGPGSIRTHIPARAATDDPEIVVEGADTVLTGSKPRDHSDPEISIERLVELEVEEPMNESELEMPNSDRAVVARGEPSLDPDSSIATVVSKRALSSTDTVRVGIDGALDKATLEQPAESKRAKRQTDAPE